MELCAGLFQDNKKKKNTGKWEILHVYYYILQKFSCLNPFSFVLYHTHHFIFIHTRVILHEILFANATAASTAQHIIYK